MHGSKVQWASFLIISVGLHFDKKKVEKEKNV